jgi:hypothetical protein
MGYTIVFSFWLHCRNTVKFQGERGGIAAAKQGKHVVHQRAVIAGRPAPPTWWDPFHPRHDGTGHPPPPPSPWRKAGQGIVPLEMMGGRFRFLIFQIRARRI